MITTSSEKPAFGVRCCGQPSRLPLLRELETNLNERLVEARERVWLGEVEGLKKTLVDLRAKTEQAERLAAAGITDTPVPLN